MGGKSSGGTKVNQYYGGFQYVLCRGPIDKITRFTSDDKIAWEGSVTGNATITIDAKQLYGGETSEGGIAGDMDIMFGGPTQTVNSYLASVLAGKLVPAYRTVVSAVLKKFYVGQNPYIKKIGFRAQRIHVRQDGIPQWYDAKAEIVAWQSAVGLAPGGWDYQIETFAEPNTVWNNFSIPTTGWNVGTGLELPFYSDKAANTGYVWFPVRSNIWIRRQLTAMVRNLTLHVRADNGCMVFVDGIQIGGSNTSNIPIVDNTRFPVDLPLIVGKTVTLVVKAFAEVLASDEGGNKIYVDVSGSLAADMNPAHMIRECLTDPDWGMGYQDPDINDSDASGNLAPLQKAADTLFEETMGMSLEWNEAGTIDDFVQNIIDHIDAAVYVDRRTGQFQLRLIRNDYDPDTLLELNPDNVTAVTDYDQPVFGELVNSITVNFTDMSTTPTTNGSVTEQDTALASAQGTVIDKEKDYRGFTNATLASRVALRDLTVASGQPVSCKVQANRDAEDLTLGMCFKLTWPDFKMDHMIMRVTGISYGNGESNRIMIQCTQDKFRLLAQGTVAPTVPGHTNTAQAPVAVARRLAMELPYAELIQTYGQSVVDSTIDATPGGGFVGVAGSRPQTGAQNADMQDDPGSGYRRVGTMFFCPSALLGADMAQGYAQLTIAVTDPIDLDGDVGAWCQIDDEVLPIISTTATTITVQRAAMDTVPAKHLTGAVVMFPDDFLTSDTEQFIDGTSVAVKLLTNTVLGQLPLASAAADTVLVAGRAALPYPPGKVQVAGAAYPAAVSGTFAVTWAHRNRLTQSDTLVAADAASVTPAPNTRYGLQFYDASNTLLIERQDIGPGTADVARNYTGDVTMRLFTIDPNGVSLYKHELKFAYTPPGGTVVSAITATPYTPVDTTPIIDGG